MFQEMQTECVARSISRALGESGDGFRDIGWDQQGGVLKGMAGNFCFVVRIIYFFSVQSALFFLFLSSNCLRKSEHFKGNAYVTGRHF